MDLNFPQRRIVSCFMSRKQRRCSSSCWPTILPTCRPRRLLLWRSSVKTLAPETASRSGVGSHTTSCLVKPFEVYKEFTFFSLFIVLMRQFHFLSFHTNEMFKILFCFCFFFSFKMITNILTVPPPPPPPGIVIVWSQTSWFAWPKGYIEK